MTLSIKHSGSSAIMLSVTIYYCHAECHYAECYYAECHYAECRYAECRGAFEVKAHPLQAKSLEILWIFTLAYHHLGPASRA
jgi:hypothetical protein